MTSVSLSSQGATLSHSATTQTATFLERCVEDLSPDKVSGFEKKARHWNIISTISTVAFFALAIGTFISISVLIPTYLPIGGICAILSAMPVVQQIQKFQQWSQAAQNEADKYKALKHQYTEISTHSPTQIQNTLLQMGIIWNTIQGASIHRPADLVRLSPLIAQAKFLEAKTQELMTAKTDYINQAQQAFSSGNIEQKVKFHKLALQCQDLALQTKIKNAFVNAVLRRPNFRGSLEDIGVLSKETYYNHVLGQALADSSSNQIFTFNNHRLTPLSFREAETMTVSQIGQRFFAAMN